VPVLEVLDRPCEKLLGLFAHRGLAAVDSALQEPSIVLGPADDRQSVDEAKTATKPRPEVRTAASPLAAQHRDGPGCDAGRSNKDMEATTAKTGEANGMGCPQQP
jgi:hypothetical protein